MVKNKGAWRIATGWMLAAALAACGGGGGGDDEFSIGLSRSDVAWTAEEGVNAHSPLLTVTSSGTPPANVYVGATTPSGQPDPNIQQVSVNVDAGTRTATILILASPELAPGTYTGTVLAQACLDEACKRPVRGSPQAITYKITVVPSTQLRVPSTLRTSAESGATATASVKVKLPAGTTAPPVVTVSEPLWMSVDDVTATGFTFRARSLPAGMREGTISVQSGSQVRSLSITHTVSNGATPASWLSVYPQGATLSAAEGGRSDPVAVAVTRPSWDPRVDATVTYQDGSGWLQPTVGDDNRLVMVADAAGLARGTYRASVALTAAYPSLAYTVAVSLTVGDGLAVPARQMVTLRSDTAPGVLNGTIPVVGNMAASFSWTATTTTPWLRLVRASGRAGEGVLFEVDATAAAAMPPFSDVDGQVTIQPASLGGGAVPFTPVTATVRLRQELADVVSVGPVHLNSGEPATVIVRGRGFDGVADLAGRLSIEGATPLAVDRLGPDTLSVKLPALAAGARAVRIGNALGHATAATTLHVLDARTLADASLVTGGVPYAVRHDPVRRALYVAMGDVSSVLRFTEGPSGWTRDSLGFADLAGLGLSPDGSLLVVAERPGALHLVDAATFTKVSSHQATEPFVSTPLTGDGLAVTNDGKVWLGLGPGWGRMATFDLASRTFADVVPGDIRTSFHGGPWFEVSRNGERLMAVQSASISSDPPMLYMDVSEGVWRVNPIGLTFFHGSENGMDDTGNRFLASGTVYDRGFAVVGSVVLPDPSWYQRAAVLSPDGRRVYVMASLDRPLYAAPPEPPPRVFVFDASVAAGTLATLPLVGSFDLAENITCEVEVGNGCSLPLMTTAADGRTLFVAGSKKLLVVPVPPAWRSPLRAKPSMGVWPAAR